MAALTEKGWKRGCLGREWKWDLWERAEVFPEILRKDEAETKTFADLSFFFPAAGCQTSKEHEEKHVIP